MPLYLGQTELSFWSLLDCGPSVLAVVEVCLTALVLFGALRNAKHYGSVVKTITQAFHEDGADGEGSPAPPKVEATAKALKAKKAVPTATHTQIRSRCPTNLLVAQNTATQEAAQISSEERP